MKNYKSQNIFRKEYTAFFLFLAFLFGKNSVALNSSFITAISSVTKNFQPHRIDSKAHLNTTNVSSVTIDDQNDLSDEEFDLEHYCFFEHNNNFLFFHKDPSFVFLFKTNYVVLKVPLYLLFCNWKIHLS